jgi:hypothetical protein
MPALSSFFTWDALITPGWILLGTAVGIHGLWVPTMTTQRKLGISAYILFGVLLVGVSWWRGAAQVEQATNLAEATHAQPNQSIDTVIGAAATKFTELESTLKQTREELSSLEAERKEQRTARHLNKMQISKLGMALSPIMPSIKQILVSTMADDGEAYQYAEDFMNALKGMGLNPIGPRVVFPTSADSCCVVVAVKNVANPPILALELVLAMRNSNIPDVGIGKLDTLSDDESFQLIIGAKRKY